MHDTYRARTGLSSIPHPPAGLGLNQGEPPSSEVVTPHSLKARPFVDDLGTQPVVIYVHSERDLALTVDYGVGSEFAHKQLAWVKLAGLEPAADDSSSRRRARLEALGSRGNSVSNETPTTGSSRQAR